MESLSEFEINEERDYQDIIESVYRPRVLAFENFTKTNDLDSFSGLDDGTDEQIKTARKLLSTYDESKIDTIKKQFQEYGDCLINEFNKVYDSNKKKADIMSGCKVGEDFKKFLIKISEVLSNVPNSTEPTSDSQSSS